MNTIYFIKDNEIYELTDEKTAKKVEIIDSIPMITEETIEYDKKNDILYTFSEIKAKMSFLFEPKEMSLDNIDEYKSIIQEKDKTIASLQAKIKELEELVEKLTKELEEAKTSTPEEDEKSNEDEEVKTKNNKEKTNK